VNIIDYKQYEEALCCEVGNKAANVSILSQKGYTVPNGFAITASFLKNCTISQNNSKLTSSFSKLKPPLVVRSSAIGEDSKDRSFAGIFDSVLNVVSLEDYISAVSTVYSSCKTPIRDNYMPNQILNMAILVQELVPAEHAGVVFTVNPANGDHSEAVIEYFNGLGVSVVSGKTTPQHLVIDRKSYKIKTFVRSGDGIGCFPNKDGGYKEVFLNGNKITCIDETMLEKIIKTATDIEELFGCPQDIEWAISGSELFILQSRPITTLLEGEDDNDKRCK
jgi:pyruvate,water dikinase